MTPSSSAVSASSAVGSGATRMRLPAWSRQSIEPQPRHVIVADLIIAFAAVGIIGFPFSLRSDYSFTFDWAVVATGVPYFLALVVRRLAPWHGFVLGTIGFLVKLCLGSPPHGVDLALLIVLFSAAAYGGRLLLWTSGVAAVVYPTLMAAYLALFPAGNVLLFERTGTGAYGFEPFMLTMALFAPMLGLVAVLSWLAGLLRRMQLRNRVSRHAIELAELEYQRSQEQLVVEQERTQIARDMHDVVAHSLAVVVAQADGGRYLSRADPTQAEPVLKTISDTAREALVDVRALLTQLRHSQSDGQQRSLDDLHRVISRMRDAGLPLRSTVTGERQPLGATGELAVYRLVQEGLTNALKYGDSSRSTVLEFHWRDGLHIRIRNRISSRPPLTAGSGHGLIGMRERLAIVGGSVTTEQHDGVFELRAHVPRLDAACPTTAWDEASATEPDPMTAPPETPKLERTAAAGSGRDDSMSSASPASDPTAPAPHDLRAHGDDAETSPA